MSVQKQKIANYKRLYLILLAIFIGLCAFGIYLKIADELIQKNISSVKNEISVEETTLNSFSDKPGFDKLQCVQELESLDSSMPRSDHINKIMAIFNELLSVDNSDTFNISFSDFHISLDNISLAGYVTNLRLLYQGYGERKALIQMFEDLDFLDNISIKTYEKSDDHMGFQFILTANVINNGK